MRQKMLLCVGIFLLCVLPPIRSFPLTLKEYFRGEKERESHHSSDVVGTVVRMRQQQNEEELTKKNKDTLKWFEDILKRQVKYDAATHIDIKGRFECAACAVVIAIIKHWLKTGTPYDEIAGSIATFCGIFHVETHEVCKGVANMFENELLDVLSNMTLTSYEFCEVTLKKNCSQHVISSMQWSIDIPDDQNKINDSVTEGPQKSKQILRVLHLTDIHVDFSYRPGSNVHCKEPLCCRNGIPSKHTEGAGFWGSLGSCDLPTWTVEDLFEKLSHEKFDYILWTGDLLSHDVWNQTKDDQLRALHYLTDLFLKYFPATPVFPALGNHEGVPVNNFPPHTFGGKSEVTWLYKELARTWFHWLPKEVGLTVSKGGFYTILIAPRYRLISLNMNFCNNMNWWLILNSTDPESELRWLVSVLQSAEENNEKVQIIGHIPPGVPDCLQAWSWNYYRIINRYKDIITAQIFGHLHYDTFQMFYDVGYKHNRKDTQVKTNHLDIHLNDPHPKGQEIAEPIAVAYVSPSVTTFYDLNPGYRVFDIDGFYDNSTWSVLDHHTYIMNLTLSNKMNKTTYVHEYSARETYGLESLLPKEWQKAIEKMNLDVDFFNKYYQLRYKMNVPSKGCKSSCKKMMLCALVSGRSYDTTFCNNLLRTHNYSSEPIDYYEFADWYNKNKLC